MGSKTVQRDAIDDFVDYAIELFPFLDRETEAAVDRIAKLTKRFDLQTDATAERFGMKRGEFRLLVKLRLAPDMRLSPGDLAAQLELSTGAMTNRLDRLEAAGLARREPDPDDRRALIVRLTPTGLASVEAALEAQGAEEQRILQALTPE